MGANSSTTKSTAQSTESTMPSRRVSRMYSSVGSGTCVYRPRERKAMASSGYSAIKIPNPMPKSATKIDKMTSMETPHFLFLSSLLRV